jgi:fibronectin-binding autotransporter adhesin
MKFACKARRWGLRAQMQAAVGAMALLPGIAAAQQVLIWDASGANPTDPVDGNGSWDTTSAPWSNGTTDQTWNNDGTSIAEFGNANGQLLSPRVTLNSSINAAGLVFNNPSNGNFPVPPEGYVVQDGPTPYPITLAGPNPTITVDYTGHPGFSAPIAGTSGLTVVAGTGGLDLAGTNTYTGTTAIDSGTVTAASLGASSNPLILGTPGTASTGNLVLAAGLTVGSLTVATNTLVANNIGPGISLTDTGVAMVGIVPGSSSGTTTSALSFISKFSSSSFTITSGFIIGPGATSPTGVNGSTIGVVDITQLSQFTMSAGAGELDVGVGYNAAGTLTLAQTNSITAAAIRVGDTQATGGGVAGVSVLILPSVAETGVNVFDVNTITLGSSGQIIFYPNPQNAGASLANEAGTGGTNIVFNGGELNLMDEFVNGPSPTITTNTTGTMANVALVTPGTGVTMNGNGTLTVSGTNSWSGPTNIQSGVVVLSAVLGTTQLNIENGATLAPAGGELTGPITDLSETWQTSGVALMLNGGGTLTLVDGAIDKFTISEPAGFFGSALVLGGGTLGFDLASDAADEIVIDGGAASVAGINTVDLFTGDSTVLNYGVYTLISDPAGGLTGTFLFPNGLTTETITIGSSTFLATLTDSPTAVTLTIPEPASASIVGMAGAAILIRRRRSCNPSA